MNSFDALISELRLSQPYFLLLSIMLGASLASFVSFLSNRFCNAIENETEIIKAELLGIKEIQTRKQTNIFSLRSSCSFCGQNIPLYLNIPIVSWLAIRGKTRCCRKPLSKDYILGETWLAAVFLLGAILIDDTSNIITFWFLAASTFLIAEIDKRILTIPFTLIANISLIYLILTYYYNLFEIGNVLITLLLAMAFTGLFSLTKLSNRYIGNGDLYFIALSSAILASSIHHLSFFILITSITYTLIFFKSPSQENPMGFPLHFSLILVLLHRLN